MPNTCKIKFKQMMRLLGALALLTGAIPFVSAVVSVGDKVRPIDGCHRGDNSLKSNSRVFLVSSRSRGKNREGRLPLYRF